MDQFTELQLFVAFDVRQTASDSPQQYCIYTWTFVDIVTEDQADQYDNVMIYYPSYICWKAIRYSARST